MANARWVILCACLPKPMSRTLKAFRILLKCSLLQISRNLSGHPCNRRDDSLRGTADGHHSHLDDRCSEIHPKARPIPQPISLPEPRRQTAGKTQVRRFLAHSYLGNPSRFLQDDRNSENASRENLEEGTESSPKETQSSLMHLISGCVPPNVWCVKSEGKAFQMSYSFPWLQKSDNALLVCFVFRYYPPVSSYTITRPGGETAVYSYPVRPQPSYPTMPPPNRPGFQAQVQSGFSTT